MQHEKATDGNDRQNSAAGTAIAAPTEANEAARASQVTEHKHDGVDDAHTRAREEFIHMFSRNMQALPSEVHTLLKRLRELDDEVVHSSAAIERACARRLECIAHGLSVRAEDEDALSYTPAALLWACLRKERIAKQMLSLIDQQVRTMDTQLNEYEHTLRCQAPPPPAGSRAYNHQQQEEQAGARSSAQQALYNRFSEFPARSRHDPAAGATSTRGKARRKRSTGTEDQASPMQQQQQQQQHGYSAEGLQKHPQPSNTGSGSHARPETEEQTWCYCNRVGFGEMVACESSDPCPIEWFHFNCVGLTSHTSIPDQWYCAECRLGFRHASETAKQLPYIEALKQMQHEREQHEQTLAQEPQNAAQGLQQTENNTSLQRVDELTDNEQHETQVEQKNEGEDAAAGAAADEEGKEEYEDHQVQREEGQQHEEKKQEQQTGEAPQDREDIREENKEAAAEQQQKEAANEQQQQPKSETAVPETKQKKRRNQRNTVTRPDLPNTRGTKRRREEGNDLVQTTLEAGGAERAPDAQQHAQATDAAEAQQHQEPRQRKQQKQQKRNQSNLQRNGNRNTSAKAKRSRNRRTRR